MVTDEPFRIAGNLYYVGAVDMAAFLLTGPVGHVLIDGGWPETAPAIIGSIAAPGFEITDVKVLPKSHAHSDHAGVLRALQQAPGAELWVSEKEASLMAAVHTRGCTSWSFPVLDGCCELLAVNVCSLTLFPFASLVEPEAYPGIQADFLGSFQTLRSLPADIVLGSHASFVGLRRTRRESHGASHPVASFIDRAGYLSFTGRAWFGDQHRVGVAERHA